MAPPSLWLGLLCLLLANSGAWHTDRRPKIYGDKLSRRQVQPRANIKLQKKIVTYHNFFRSRVQPAATNMLAMRWDRQAAKDAQIWAQQCRFLEHQPLNGRWHDSLGSCGQNIFIATHKMPWSFAVRTWYLEHRNFTYGSSNNILHDVGHYTQLVWASSHRVGCGWAKCRNYFSYVCNYCPSGNLNGRIGDPYETGGGRCSACPGHCRLGRLCTNSCSWADQWANCEQLASSHRSWVCTGDRLNHCKATCSCKGKLY